MAPLAMPIFAGKNVEGCKARGANSAARNQTQIPARMLMFAGLMKFFQRATVHSGGALSKIGKLAEV